MSTPCSARFDDLRTDEALVFDEPAQVVTAHRADEVAGVLATVDAATRDGAWAFGYLAYEAAPGVDADMPVRDNDTPLAWFGLTDAPRRTPAIRTPTGRRNYWTAPWTLGWTRDQHATAVQVVQDAIAAGDVYQVNITARLTGRIVGDPVEFYADLAQAQQSQYSAYLDVGSAVVISASPELFFDWTPPLLRTRPMKGTAARGATEPADRALRERLAASTKDVAENVMIVDLLRNDLSRIARTGTVRVPALLRIEQYPSVWQLTSDVVCEPRPDVDVVDILSALFPSGSVTGAPKLAAMRAIRAVECEPRGVYCGAIGWIAPSSSPTRARFSVAIRTVEIDRSDGVARYGTGGGITASSVASDEFDELLAKTAVLTLADTEPDEPLRLLETLALVNGTLRHRDRHLARIAASARTFGVCVDEQAIRTALDDAVRGRGSARVALRLSVDGTVDVRVAPMPPVDAAPVRLAVDPERVVSSSIWLRHKTSRRDVYEQARRRHPTADDVLLVNERNEITEATIANVAVRFGGEWCTPPVASGCLPGIGRAVAIEQGELIERVIGVDELRRCDEIALVSSLRGWRTARLYLD